MSSSDRGSGDHVGAPPPKTVDEALARALRHGRNALAEGLLAGRALLDAASIAVSGRPAKAQGHAEGGEPAQAIGLAADMIDRLAERLRVDSPDTSLHLVQALLEALDVEIERWEVRARRDPDARAVLRAFLGLRELLWELGMRPSEAAKPGAKTSGASRRQRTQKRPEGKAKKPKRPEPAAASSAGAINPARRPGSPAPAGRRRVQRVEIER